MKRAFQWSIRSLAVFGAFLLLGTPVAAAAVGVADAVLGTNQVEWVPNQEFAGLKLTVSGPDGVTEHVFGPGENPRFELAALAGSVDGIYNWELTASPVLDANVRSVMAESRVDGAGDGARSRPAGLPPRDSLIQSGSFRVVDGAIVQPADEAGSPTITTTGDPNVRRVTAADQVIPDDLIVQMSLCVGFDCVNNENFGFDTLRLKENNLRIHFDDTSSTGSFPNRDWRLVANDSANGGRNVFFLEDSTASREVFSVEAGAPSNALWVDSTGNIGAGTSTPVLQLHIKDGNTPGMRLEQDNSSGFTAQTWDVAGNEANFFVRDVTGGSLLSFRIRPGAPTSSIDVAADGDVGIGTASPDSSLHVFRSNGSALLTVEETNATAAQRELFLLENNGGVRFAFLDNSTGARIAMRNVNAQFQIDTDNDLSPELRLDAAGDMTIDGMLMQGSSRHIKTGFETLDGEEVLARLDAMPVSTWSYKQDHRQVRHAGPMAEDFYAAFGLGADDAHIAPGDQAGVALAAIQALSRTVREKDATIEDLKTRVGELETLLLALTVESP